jgi:integrase
VNHAKIHDEIARLMSAVDRNSPIGKRDYAFMLSAARLGLRAGDICALSFDNVNWEDNLVEIIQSKPQRALTLPLTEDVGTR